VVLTTALAGEYVSFGQMADLCNTQAWKLDAAFRRGLLPAAEKLNGRRYLRRSDTETVKRILQENGYAPTLTTGAGRCGIES
jgi:hypothetical protein